MAIDPPKRKPRPEERTETPPETPPAPAAKKGGLKGILYWVGFSFLSMFLVTGGMYFLVKSRRPTLEPAPVIMPDSLVAAMPDTLVMDPQDSLRTRIADLQATVVQREDSLAKTVDTTRQLITYLERLQKELDTMQQRDLVLSSEEVARLSRVFGSMQPRKAAPVLLRMDNASVAAILLMVEERTAAKIMAAMPPDRAAGISTLIREQAEEKARRVKAKS